MDGESSSSPSPLASPPWDETARLGRLHDYAILDTPTEPEFDDIARLAADTFDAPIAVVNLIADGRQWFKAEVGIGTRELPLEVSICAHAFLERDLMVVPDTTRDPRFACNPLVDIEDGLRFYAGALLKTEDGLPLGTVCVLDRVARPQGITPRQRLTLEVLARQVMAQLELRRMIGLHKARSEQLETEAAERRVTEAALSETEARYRVLFDSLDAGFCIVAVAFDERKRATDYRFIDVNPAFADQTGFTDAAGKWIRDLAPEHEQYWFDVFGAVALTGESVRFEQAAAAIGGRWYDVHAFRIGPADDRRVAILFNDISERRNAELALKALNETLDLRVSEAVEAREVAQDALRQSQKMDAIGQLTGGVAHDFNNLLTVIRGSVELLRRPGLQEARRVRYVEAIGETADRAAKLTGQLLAFARRQALKPELFDLRESVRGVSEMISTLVGSRIVLDTQLSVEPCWTLADPSQFDTALVNLAVNARDAMMGAGRIVVAVGPVSGMPALRDHSPAVGEFVAVAVSDTGAGIPADALGRIFEPFFTTKPAGTGTGLGLSQVIGFAKQSGGDIGVESELGAGTTFTLYLPRAAAPTDDSAPAVDPERVSVGQRLCVLVVEDNQKVGEFATEALKELGHDSRLAANAEEALAVLADPDQPFQIVFSDVVMPGMSGLDLGQEIRRRHPDIPVILTSGYSHVLSQNGSHGFELLHKPYSIEQLARVLRKAAAWHADRLAKA